MINDDECRTDEYFKEVSRKGKWMFRRPPTCAAVAGTTAEMQALIFEVPSTPSILQWCYGARLADHEQVVGSAAGEDVRQ